MAGPSIKPLKGKSFERQRERIERDSKSECRRKVLSKTKYAKFTWTSLVWLE